MSATYYNNCVSWPPADVRADGGLSDMVQAERTITRRTFLKHVDREQLAELELALGYERNPSRGLTMAGDWHVSYHKSKLHGQTVWFITQSGIEYVFK